MPVRVAVSSVVGSDDVATPATMAAAGAAVRDAMEDAAASGARVVLFHEGALTYPHKRKISSDPDRVGPADWSRVDWDAIAGELHRIAGVARALSLWTVIHAPHRLSGSNRPHNSLYVIADTGDVVGRYDKRLLSDTELRWLYTPGTRPLTFDVDGYRFGCALCIEQAFPEVFVEYATLGVDCVLMASGGNDLHLRAHASANGLWIAFAERRGGEGNTSGIIDPDGTWQCRAEPGVRVAIGELDRDDPRLGGPLFGRAWRNVARSGAPYEDLFRPDDPRSLDRTSF